jgi:2-phospho-L-lactate guanylyltransferase
MKPLDQAKTRLWTDVPTFQREGVILLMLECVLRAAVDALGTAACQVVGGDEVVRHVTESTGAMWREEQGNDLNSSLWLAMMAAQADGCAATLFLPGDLPRIAGGDVAALAQASDEHTRAVGVRASTDGGTNALLVPTATAFEPLLGKESFSRHREAAERAGTPLVELDLPGAAFDMDSFEDMRWALDNIEGFPQRLDDWQAWLYDRRR